MTGVSQQLMQFLLLFLVLSCTFSASGSLCVTADGLQSVLVFAWCVVNLLTAAVVVSVVLLASPRVSLRASSSCVAADRSCCVMMIRSRVCGRVCVESNLLGAVAREV